MFRPDSILPIVVCLLLGGGSGCAIFQPEDEAQVTERSPLKRVRPSVDAIQLDVLFVERPIGDPILGDALWSHLDQVSSLDAPTLSSLERNGIKFGIAPTDPPRALQAALGMTGEMVPRDSNEAYGPSGRSVARRSGEELAVDAWSGYSRCEIAINKDGQSETHSYDNARCVYRIRVERVQDGWAQLEFIPEIHHGAMKLRSVPRENSWTTTPSQLVDPQFDQRFHVELNLGEMVVLGARGDDPESLGHHFFRGGETGSRLQRLLIVRLADMQRIHGIAE